MSDLIRNILRSLIPTLKTWAADTDTKLDDRGVEILEMAVENDYLFDWLQREFVSATPIGVDTKLEDLPFSVQNQLAYAGVYSDDDVRALATAIAPAEALVANLL
jgi:hypothetical protein